MTTSVGERWSALLDEIEQGVEACNQRYLCGGDVDIDVPLSFTPAPDPGPLPASLEPRARVVLERLRSVEAMIERVPRPGVVPRATRFTTPAHRRATFEREI
jgi:hypothetical protein